MAVARGRRPSRGCWYCRKRLRPKSRFCPGAPDPKARFSDLGQKRQRRTSPRSVAAGCPHQPAVLCPAVRPGRVCRGLWRAAGHGGRVHTGHLVMPVDTELQSTEPVTEGLRRAKFKSPGSRKEPAFPKPRHPDSPVPFHRSHGREVRLC
uniref:Uncharacterized protein n=1 Tax=Rousettus aegyptiacus TaxID=9407 RepID=A0A7J8H1P7_ROUAE|nr:hypothetical protein HJG63_011409 [Rousettus aegyptiacus]